MDDVTRAVTMWQMEAAMAVSIFAFVYIYNRSIKLWMAREGVSLVFILGFGLAIVTVIFFFLRDRIHFANHYALFFMLLYCWCALGTVFVAARQTHAFKLFIGLLSQAGIVYSLYLWV